MGYSWQSHVSNHRLHCEDSIGLVTQSETAKLRLHGNMATILPARFSQPSVQEAHGATYKDWQICREGPARGSPRWVEATILSRC